jgi:hypothetical protein
MKSWRTWFDLPRQLLKQKQELHQLRGQIEKLQAPNDSMRQGMRRCVTCDYRIDYKQRQHEQATNNTSHS